MTKNLPMKINNYGETEIFLVTHIEKRHQKLSYKDKNKFNKSLINYEINFKKFEELSKFLEKNFHTFERFLKKDTIVLKSHKYSEKLDEKTGKIKITGHCAKIDIMYLKKSFLSFIKQGEEQLIDVFCTNERKENVIGLTTDLSDRKNRTDGEYYINIMKNPLTENVLIRKKKILIRIVNGRIIIKNKRCLCRKVGKKYYKIYHNSFEKVNNYKKIVEELEELFRNVNENNNNNIDDYVTQRINELKKLEFAEELKRMQQPIKNIRRKNNEYR